MRLAFGEFQSFFFFFFFFGLQDSFPFLSSKRACGTPDKSEGTGTLQERRPNVHAIGVQPASEIPLKLPSACRWEASQLTSPTSLPSHGRHSPTNLPKKRLCSPTARLCHKAGTSCCSSAGAVMGPSDCTPNQWRHSVLLRCSFRDSCFKAI